MVAKTLCLVTLSILLSQPAHAQLETRPPAVGDTVFIGMRGEAARAYFAAISRPEPRGGDGTVEMPATIKARDSDGKYRIENETPLQTADKPRMVTVTAIVSPADITADVTPKGTLVAADPVSYQNGNRVRTIADARNLRIELTDLHNVKLRTWELVKEVGK
jgi:hypothetical protein